MIKRLLLTLVMFMVACSGSGGSSNGAPGLGSVSPDLPSANTNTSASSSSSSSSSSTSSEYTPSPTVEPPAPSTDTLTITVDSVSTCIAGSPPTSYELYDANSGSPPAIDRLAHLGSRSVAGGDNVGGFITFNNGDLLNPTPTPVVSLGAAYTQYTIESASVGAAGSSSGLVEYRQYSSSGSPLTGNISVATGLSGTPQGLAMDFNGSTSLITWVTDRKLFAASVNLAGQVSAAFQIFTGNVKQVTISHPDSSSFAVVWSVLESTMDTSLYFTLTDATHVTLDQPFKRIFTSATSRYVKKLIPLATGYAILASGDSGAEIFTLSSAGVPSYPAHGLSGAHYAWDLVLNGSELGLVADLNSASPNLVHNAAFRKLDLSGAPTSTWATGWTCFTNYSSLEPGGRDLPMAIDALNGNYMVIYRLEDDSKPLLGRTLYDTVRVAEF